MNTLAFRSLRFKRIGSMLGGIAPSPAPTGPLASSTMLASTDILTASGAVLAIFASSTRFASENNLTASGASI